MREGFSYRVLEVGAVRLLMCFCVLVSSSSWSNTNGQKMVFSSSSSAKVGFLSVVAVASGVVVAVRW